MKKLFYFIIILIFGACSVTTEEKATATSSTTIPDYETTTLSGKMVGVAWTFDTGNVVVPTSGSTYWYNMTSDNLSNACSPIYTGTSSIPVILFTRSEAPSVGETELGSGNTVTFYDGSSNYIVTTGKITIDTHTTTALTGKMYAIYGTDTDHEINGTFTLSRCCTSGSSYALCE